MLTKEIN